MATYQPSEIRNVALVGHGDAGKTTLAEHLLLAAGMIDRVGTVNEGNTVADFNDDERDRKHSIDPALLHIEHDGRLLNLIDTPGSPDFIGDALCCLSVVETAVITIAATTGIAVNTRRMWLEARNRGLARMIVITKLDADNLELDKLIAGIQERFGSECVPLTYPDATGDGLSKVVNLFTNPDDCSAPQAGDWREALIERIVESDEALMEKYFEGEVEDSALAEYMPKAIAAGTLVPILCTSLEKELGIGDVLAALTAYAPSPTDVPAREAGAPDDATKRTAVEPTVDGPFAGQVFSLMTDDYVGRISFFRIFGGTLKDDEPVFNPEGGKPEKMGAMIQVQGKEQKEVSSANAGMIVGITKVEGIGVGSTICAQSNPVVFDKFALPKPMVSLSLTPKSRADEGKIGAALKRLCDEKLTFTAVRNAATRELVASGVTDLHLLLMLDRLKSRFNVDVDTHRPRIAYLETITRSANSKYRHKKQTGGRGQFGEVWIEVSPRPRGEGFEFQNAIVGGVIPNQFIPAVEKGIKATMAQGVVAGYEMVDVKVKLYDGKHHSVDSSEEAFKRAGSEAFKLAVADAGPTLLEPVCDIDITVPTDKMGDINGDLNSRRGQIQGMDSQDDYQVIKARVPLGEVQTYSTELRSMTGGEGSYTLEFSHYDIVPAHKVADIIRATKKAEEEKEKKK